MNTLSQTTLRRLQKIPQIPSVWEGDRRSLAGIGSSDNLEDNGECVIWVDGSEGFVRGMEIVAPETGPEALVRTLIRAMENPHSPAQPARPQKIVVRNREIQFFLRGALQSLDIAINYVPDLPLIDELFRSFEQSSSARLPTIPPQYESQLIELAYDIWNDGPWEFLADHDILSMEIDLPEVGTLYACLMGMLGKEYGVLLYRSLDSLKRFRSSALIDSSMQELEQAFLAQDCWFLNFDPADEELDDEDDEDFDLADLPISEIQPLFGSVHPYEGIRPFLDEEEAKVIYIALKSLHNFCQELQPALSQDTIGALSKQYEIPIAGDNTSSETVSVKISTLPELADELIEMLEMAEDEEFTSSQLSIPIQEDLVPDKSLLSLSIISGNIIEKLRESGKSQGELPTSPSKTTTKSQGMPVILIQTSRPKAMELINKIQSDGGLKKICFNPGEDPLTGITYNLGILQTGNGNLHLCGEFNSEEPRHVKAIEQWKQGCKQTKGECGLIVAMGVTGASRGNPQLKDMLALFETKAMKAEELGMGLLELMPQFEVGWE